MKADEPSSWVLTSVSLNIEGKNLDPGEVTGRLGITPTGSVAPGEDFRDPESIVGYWVLKFDEGYSRIFSEQLEAVLSAAEEGAEKIREMRREGRRVWVEVYGFSGNESKLSFSARDMARLAELGIPLRLTPNLNDR